MDLVERSLDALGVSIPEAGAVQEDVLDGEEAEDDESNNGDGAGGVAGELEEEEE